MADKIAAFILTHGRSDRVYTYDILQKCGFTGEIFLVVDDEDSELPAYQEKYGSKVLTFSKAKAAESFDEGDNFKDRRAVVYARNENFRLAQEVGYRYFVQLDDDYTDYAYRFDDNYRYVYGSIRSLDGIFQAMVDYLKITPFKTLAILQGGDYFGGGVGAMAEKIMGLRKIMNLYVCDTERPFQFYGRINEDTTLYTCSGRRGDPFLSLNQISLQQKQTQSNEGGLTDIYLSMGTYVKSFYSVMYAPSCVDVVDMGQAERRIHHRVAWDHATPKIIREQHRKRAA